MIEQSNQLTNMIFVGLGALFLLTASSVLVLCVSRGFSPRRQVLRNSLVIFCFTFVVLKFPLTGKLAFLAALLMAMCYVIAQVLFSRYCVVCRVPILSGLLFSRVVHCPACGGEGRFVWQSHT